MRRILLAIACGVVVIFFVFALSRTCGEARTMRVSGESLAGIVENGAEVTVVDGYYACHTVRRGDVVAYRHTAATPPLIKIVKAIPGDEWKLERHEQGWEVIVNGTALVTLAHETYALSDARAHMLNLYVHDYGGRIPPNAVLLLGNISSGSFDSSMFGLADIGSITGKVIR